MTICYNVDTLHGIAEFAREISELSRYDVKLIDRHLLHSLFIHQNKSSILTQLK